MNYYPKTHTPAINWGVYNEPGAISDFVKAQRRYHKNMKVKSCGVFICAQFPYLAASPDAIITCDFSGDGPLEVKNPLEYANSHSSHCHQRLKKKRLKNNMTQRNPSLYL